MNPIYIDNLSTTPVDPLVLNEMLPYFCEKFGNASSRSHSYGWDAEEAVEIAREQVALLIGANASEIYFTSGATESNNIVIKSFVGKSVVISSIEHSSVTAPAEWIKIRGSSVIRCGVLKNGVVDLNQFQDILKNNVIDFVSIMAVNNEVGVIQPLDSICQISKSFGAVAHSDITQAVGKIPINVNAMNLDFASLSAHKIYGPKGIGAMYVRDGLLPMPLLHGGGQEHGFRSGTLNVPAIVGFGKACELARLTKLKNELILRDFVQRSLEVNIPGSFAHGENRVDGSLNMYFPCDNMTFMMANLVPCVSLSFGSACMSTSNKSPTLEAMGVKSDIINKSLRMCFGRFNTQQQAVDVVSHIINAFDSAQKGVINVF